ncbi:Crp/Fnr family transcriptional regulator [Thermospira aquatica]|uniref:Cyclic nucleotide-binding domain-containing protein n=1 Tax=Thermospira aquatica TaxID=2828656 RepID=A0AAX3BC48_9SPIR|nr:cyclic nucleotide-binding domain-containing protein [Thermospira aquatica]URA09690.1 cyclic nucleotide-binding domain-containing protein [Thermospira aquatica]
MADSVAFQVANYKKGSYIIVEDEEKSDEFYIIRQGKVVEYRSVSIVQQEEQGTVLGTGDFFGVLSCMSRRPRIETVQALEDVSCIVVKREQFGELIQKNTAIAMKILRYFGKQLRYYDSQLTQLHFKNSLEEDPSHLFAIGEYFFSNQLLIQAAYAYLRYIKYCPDGGYVNQAKIKLAKINPSPEKLQPQKENFFSLYEDGQIIFLEHEPGNELYIIQEGKVKITKLVGNNEVLLAVLKKGDIFGEMALLDNKPRSASAIAFGPTKLMAINRANFEPTVQAHPEIATKIIELLSERIWIIYKQLSNSLIPNPVGKIYDALYTQLQKARIPIVPGASHTFDFGPDEVIKFVGFSAQEGRLHLKKLMDEDKTIQIIENKIICKDIGALENSLKVIKRQLEIERKKRSSSGSSMPPLI